MIAITVAGQRPATAFPLPPAELIIRWRRHGPTHHCALGVGHQAERIAKVGRLLGLEVAYVG